LGGGMFLVHTFSLFPARQVAPKNAPRRVFLDVRGGRGVVGCKGHAVRFIRRSQPLSRGARPLVQPPTPPPAPSPQALGLEVRSVLAIGGIGGLAIGLAGREICENLLNGFLLMTTVGVPWWWLCVFGLLVWFGFGFGGERWRFPEGLECCPPLRAYRSTHPHPLTPPPPHVCPRDAARCPLRWGRRSCSTPTARWGGGLWRGVGR
jgi:hypothetical protein